MRRHLRRNRRCLSRHTGYHADVTRAGLPAQAAVCNACRDECANHASQHERCCGRPEACRRSEKADNNLLASLA